jgi:hypothetical protein
MCNDLNLKILIHIFIIICLIMIINIMTDENFVAHRCAAEHRLRITGLRHKTHFYIPQGVEFSLRAMSRLAIGSTHLPIR